MLGIFLTLTFIGQLSDAQVTREIKVYVSVECDNENTETLIKSWTKRELRNLLDVNLVGVVDAEVMLILFTKEPKHETGEETGGIVISYTFSKEILQVPPWVLAFTFLILGLQQAIRVSI
jgi:hypothetical protein